jgi:2-keto-3-deoxy-L-rhamnonate aldolase RhmA
MTNSMKQKLAAGELVLCTNLRLARTVDIAMLAEAGGYDALYLDVNYGLAGARQDGTALREIPLR